MGAEIGANLCCKVFPFFVVHSFIVKYSPIGAGFVSNFSLKSIWEKPLGYQNLVVALGACVRIVRII